MTWKELFTYDRKSIKTLPDKIKFYSVFAMAGLVLGLGYGLFPYLYSNEYLVEKTKQDFTYFVKTDKPILDTRFTFAEKERKGDCVFSVARSKYVNYSIANVDCKGVKHE